MRYVNFTPSDAIDGFALVSADARRMARVHSVTGDANAAKRARGMARRAGKLSKNAEGMARREAKLERQYLDSRFSL